MELGNNIWLFPSSTQNLKKNWGGYQIIIISLTLVNDILLNGISLLCQKVLELSLGFSRFPIPFRLVIFYSEKSYNYLIFFINYLLFFILINFINIEISYNSENLKKEFNEDLMKTTIRDLS